MKLIFSNFKKYSIKYNYIYIYNKVKNEINFDKHNLLKNIEKSNKRAKIITNPTKWNKKQNDQRREEDIDEDNDNNLKKFIKDNDKHIEI